MRKILFIAIIYLFINIYTCQNQSKNLTSTENLSINLTNSSGIFLLFFK